MSTSLAIPAHRMCRWDEPNDECFNIELSNNNGFDNPTDEECRTNSLIPFTTEEQEKCGWLKSLTPRQELASFIVDRAFYYLDRSNYRKAVDDFRLAVKLDTERPLTAQNLITTLNRWREHLQVLMPPNCPRISLVEPPLRYPNLPECVEKQIVDLEVLEDVLANPMHQQWWEMLRQFPEQRPDGVPSRITVTLHR